jgi:hypothetical protein
MVQRNQPDPFILSTWQDPLTHPPGGGVWGQTWKQRSKRNKWLSVFIRFPGSAVLPGRSPGWQEESGCPASWVMRHLELSHYLNSPTLVEHSCFVPGPRVPRSRPTPGVPASKGLHLQPFSWLHRTSSHTVATQGNGSWAVGGWITSSLLLLFTYQMIINYTSIKGLHSLQAWAHQPTQCPKEVKNQETTDLPMTELTWGSESLVFSLCLATFFWGEGTAVPPMYNECICGSPYYLGFANVARIKCC